MRNLVLVLIAALAIPAIAGETIRASSTSGQERGSMLHVETFGSGPPILFLHGGLVYFANNFARQRDYFASFRRVIGIDQRGHGHSPDTPEPFSYREMAEDTAAVIRRLGVAPVDVVGHSDGGDVGLLLAVHHPELVRRLVISGANLRAGLPAEELQRRRGWTDAQTAEKVQQIAAMVPPSFRTDYESVTPEVPGHWSVLLRKSYDLWLTPVVVDPADLRAVQVPVLVMAGDHDFGPIEGALEIYRALPHGQLFIVPASGHGTFLDRAELVNLAVRQFLDGDASRLPAH